MQSRLSSDWAKVVGYALRNAVSVYGLVVTTRVMVAEAPEKDAGSPMPGGGMGGMGGMYM